ncbi:class I SAM-dependent methyltransferase [Consotaella aegiceratis]|uniref:class I SAM-dependent methyltransferase n=1 Tax=Consotaella aegiceratis TaxID=3097961 RepID=UPI002F3EDC14
MVDFSYPLMVNEEHTLCGTAMSDNSELSSDDREIDQARLKCRYDVSKIEEDDWHRSTEIYTNKIIELSVKKLAEKLQKCPMVLNAGCGSTQLDLEFSFEICLDIFMSPLYNRDFAVCGSAEMLPLKNESVDLVICVGEVIAYCDPSRFIKEAYRVLSKGGFLVFDFCSTNSFRFYFTKTYGRMADIVCVEYNNAPERTWVYSPSYMREITSRAGFIDISVSGTHGWSALLQRFGLRTGPCLLFQKILRHISPAGHNDIITMIAEKP